MNTFQDGSTDQNIVWNGLGGQGWVEAQALLDHAFKPQEDLLVDAVWEASARRVLDVGCGTGATTVAVALRLGVGSSSLGIDISEAMIEAARTRAERDCVAARFICSDAQTYVFDPASVDMIISRFGVMFFDDPVQAFSNLRSAASASAELRCIAWRGPEENLFMTTAEKAAEPLLPGVSRRVPDEPGQFGFADQDRVRDILTQSEWRGISIAPIDVPCTFPASELELYLRRLGPVGRALQGADDETRAKVVEMVRPSFDPYIHGVEVRFTAACWMICARAGA
ncbi:class I SAM-dependent methyltransferase [Aquisalimonas lutea]|uniref:class I SAM-dependent methyltransferase n=1 Tax=Aquisalimonas lutea TaxID=1327750 RepID=UPI0025B34603|nr:class I SAM-dependent methyltransferase [Aquisalimonas lutea]MDN3519375.1 class I SAM-dependent methyltransferase [Aquisalimonas lutea]